MCVCVCVCVTLLSLNVRGIRDRTKRNNIFAWCKSKGCDIVFLQETYSNGRMYIEERWSSEWDGSMFFSHGSNHSRGALVLLSPNLKFKVEDVLLDNDWCYITQRRTLWCTI